MLTISVRPEVAWSIVCKECFRFARARALRSQCSSMARGAPVLPSLRIMISLVTGSLVRYCLAQRKQF
jgi:hypothetical protein